MGIGVLAPLQLDPNSLRVGYDKQLRMKSPVEDIYSALSGLTKPATESKSIPNAIYMTVEAEALNGSNSAVVTMKKPLQGAGVFGNAIAIGAEERPVTKSFRVWRNNCRKVITTPGYGIRKLDSDYLKLYPQHIDDLATWNKEQEGLEIRMAFLQQFGFSLQFGDTAANCAQNWNPNIFVCGLPLRNCSPQYSANVATYSTNIINTIIAAGGGSILPTVGQTFNQPNASNLSNFALERRIEPLKIAGLPGGKGFVVTMSERQAAFVSDPAWSARNLGSLIMRNQLPEPTASWPGVIGAYKDLLFVLDVRQPTMNPTGSSAPFGLSAGYLWPGDIDTRYRDDRDVIDTIYLHGANSVFKWEPEKLHHITQEDDYARIVGHGTARVWGHRIPIYDQTIPNMGSWEYWGGVLCLCRLPDYV